MLTNNQLAIAPIGWTNDDDPTLGGDISFQQCIDEMQQAGFEGTELGSKFPKNAVELRQQLSMRNLTLSSAWFSSQFTNPDDFQQSIESFLVHASFLKACGAGVINVCEVYGSIQQKSTALFGDQKPVFTEHQWQRLFDGLHTIGRIAHSMDMRIAYHFHLGTGVQTQAEVDKLMAHTSPELVGLLLDTGHAYAAAIDMDHLIKHYGHRVNLLHLKDVRPAVLQQVKQRQLSFMEGVRLGMFTVPGDGCIDFKAVLADMHRCHYTGWLVVEAEQDPAMAEPIIYARKAIQYLKNLREGV